MEKHIFVSSLTLKKNSDGNWYVGNMITDIGKFDLGKEISQKLDQTKISVAVDNIKKEILPQIESFVVAEIEEERQQKDKK